MKDIIIVIPARYGSTRFPGKPLVKIAGIEMLKRVSDIAKSVAEKNESCDYQVATDDERIVSFCQQFDVPVVMTPSSCKNGTQRCWQVIHKLGYKPKFIINLQGDNPLCPPKVVQTLIDNWRTVSADIFTPYVQLSWHQYTNLVKNKQRSPFSGTTVLVNSLGFAMAFSKNILPAIRDVEVARKKLPFSPVKQHIGLYGYTYHGLSSCIQLPETLYEQGYIEGLEQMGFLEHGLSIKMVRVDYAVNNIMSGIDCFEDAKLVEKMLIEFNALNLD